MAWTSFVNSTTADANEINANFDYSEGDIVPHSQGTLANNQFKLGTTTARWASGFINSLTVVNIIAAGTLSSFGHSNPSQTVDVSGKISIFGNTQTGGGTGVDAEAIRIRAMNDTSSVYGGIRWFDTETNTETVGIYAFRDSALNHLLITNMGSETARVRGSNWGFQTNFPSQVIDVTGNIAATGNFMGGGNLSITGQAGIGATLTANFVKASSVLLSGEMDAGGQPEVKVSIGTATGLSNGVFATLTWVEIYDTHGMFTSTLPSRLYAPTAGTYALQFRFNPTISNTISRCFVSVQIDGTSTPNLIQYNPFLPSSTDVISEDFFATTRLNAGQFIEVRTVLTGTNSFVDSGTYMSLIKLF